MVSAPLSVAGSVGPAGGAAVGATVGAAGSGGGRRAPGPVAAPHAGAPPPAGPAAGGRPAARPSARPSARPARGWGSRRRHRRSPRWRGPRPARRVEAWDSSDRFLLQWTDAGRPKAGGRGAAAGTPG